MTPDLPTGPALDALAHSLLGPPWDESRCRVCGWPLGDLSRWSLGGGVEPRPVCCVATDCCERPVPKVRADAPPPYSTSRTKAGLLLEEIERRGLAEEFMARLEYLLAKVAYREKQTPWHVQEHWLKKWTVLRVDAEMLTQAAVLAARGEAPPPPVS